MLLCVCICMALFKHYNAVRLFCRQHLGIQSWMTLMTKRWHHIDFAALLGLHITNIYLTFYVDFMKSYDMSKFSKSISS